MILFTTTLSYMPDGTIDRTPDIEITVSMVGCWVLETTGVTDNNSHFWTFVWGDVEGGADGVSGLGSV